MKLRIKGAPALTDEQRAILVLLEAQSRGAVEGIKPANLLSYIHEAGFDDLTLDDLTGKGGLQFLGLHGLARLSPAGCWSITRKGKTVLA